MLDNNDSFYGLWLDERCVGNRFMPRDGNCDENDLHPHMVSVGVVIISSWSLPLLIVDSSRVFYPDGF